MGSKKLHNVPTCKPWLSLERSIHHIQPVCTSLDPGFEATLSASQEGAIITTGSVVVLLFKKDLP